MIGRRGFLAALAGAMVLDPERLLWVPGAKTISIPKPPAFAVGDIVTIEGFPYVMQVVREARSLDLIQDARFKVYRRGF